MILTIWACPNVFFPTPNLIGFRKPMRFPTLKKQRVGLRLQSFLPSDFVNKSSRGIRQKRISGYALTHRSTSKIPVNEPRTF